jgi:Tol biopolymer transport system component
MGMTRTVHLLASALLGVLLVCGAFLVGLDEQAQAAFPGRNDKIAYEESRFDISTSQSSQVIMTVFPDGTGASQLTSNSYAFSPDFSADGTKIVYASRDLDQFNQRNIWVMDRFGNGKKLLTNTVLWEHGPAWSTDGTKIAFTRRDEAPNQNGGIDYQHNIWVMDSDGSNEENLTENAPDSNTGAEWSPDGTKIAFACNGDICTMNPDGTGRENITNSPGSSEILPAWSPEGERLAFASDQDVGSHRYNIHTIRLDGTGMIKITNTPYVNDTEPEWSPRGTKIVFRKTSRPDGGYIHDIYTKNADGSGLSKILINDLPNDPQYQGAPDWGPKPKTKR